MSCRHPHLKTRAPTLPMAPPRQAMLEKGKHSRSVGSRSKCCGDHAADCMRPLHRAPLTCDLPGPLCHMSTVASECPLSPPLGPQRAAAKQLWTKSGVLYTHMYVCKEICMYVCMHVCMWFVCMYVCVYIYIYTHINVCIYIYTYEK